MMDLFFKEMVEVVKEITPMWRTWDMHAIMQRLHEAYQSKKPLCFKIQEDTLENMQAMLSLWQHNHRVSLLPSDKRMIDHSTYLM